MESEPKEPRRINHEDALVMAEADVEGWRDAQIWTLEDYLVRRGGGGKLDEQLRALKGYTLENLTELGNQYNLLSDFDLQTESLKVYCGRHDLELL